MFRNLAEILERAHQQSIPRNKPEPYPEAAQDAVVLGLFLRARIGDIKRAVECDNLRILTSGDGDVCPTCAGYTWGRPMLPDEREEKDRHDYSLRECHECCTVRNNPPEASHDTE